MLIILGKAILPGIVAATESYISDFDAIFQQDRTPSHLYFPVRENLDKEFPGRLNRLRLLLVECVNE